MTINGFEDACGVNLIYVGNLLFEIYKANHLVAGIGNIWGREGKGRDGKGREGKGWEGRGRDGKGGEGKR